MTKCPLCGIDLDVDNVELQSHLSDLHGNRIEMAKALANILERLEVLERRVEKSHGPWSLVSVDNRNESLYLSRNIVYIIASNKAAANEY